MSAIVLVKCVAVRRLAPRAKNMLIFQEFIFIGIFLKFSFKIGIFAFILTAYRLKF